MLSALATVPPRNAANNLRVVLADDHRLVRHAVKSMLGKKGFDVVGEASDGISALQLCSDLRPDVAVLDLTMPLLNGIDAARRINEVCCNTKVVLLTIHTESQYVWESLNAGVKGYVYKTDTATDLVQALDAVCKGHIYLSRAISPAVLEAYRNKTRLAAPLASRERQVLCGIAAGKSTKEIAELLGISLKTVQCHRANIMDKLGLQGTASLVRYAISCGFVAPDCERGI